MAMTQNQIKRKREDIKAKIAKLVSEYAALQEFCTHPNVTKKYDSDTGNYCKSDDRYWIEYTCPDCGKFWETDQ